MQAASADRGRNLTRRAVPTRPAGAVLQLSMTVRQLAVAMIATLTAVVSTATAQGGDVEVQLEQFGVGSAFRPGDVVAIRLSLTSSLDEATLCWVQWEVPNAEGDVAEYGRSVTLNPGTPASIWLYAPIPPQASAQTIWTIRVFEERDGRRRRELGGKRIAASAPGQVGIDDGMIAVIGRARMRLDDYANPRGPWNRANPPGAHEGVRIVSGIEPRELPDRWEGLKAFEAVVWSDALPQELRVDAAGALREYIRRGGHLVITLPQTGNPWGLGAVGQTYLDDLLLPNAPRKDEAVRLSELVAVLSKSQRVLRDIELSIRVFKEIGGEFDAIDNHYEPLIALPDGRVIAVQRTFGFGRITILGIDLASQQLASMGLPQADAFWNRVLGRRADTPRANELLVMENADPRLLARGSGNRVTIGDGRLFEMSVSKTGEAGGGLLGAFVLFAAYLIIAGPGGFFLLKQQGYVKHSWVAFAATAGLFTAIAWGGVRIFRQHGTELRHVTFLDHVARPLSDSSFDEPQFQRATCWSSLYSPGYGDVRISIDSEPQQRDLLLSWAAPEKVAERFPNVDRYRVDVGKAPADYDIPVRATATQLYAQWLGALDPDWGGMLRVDPADPIRVEPDPATGDIRLAGSITHDLPGPLTDVRVIWVGNERADWLSYARNGDAELPWTDPPRDRGRDMLNAGHMWALSARDPWYSGTPLSLTSFVPSNQTTLVSNIYKRYIRDYEKDTFIGSGLGGSPSGMNPPRQKLFIEMLSIFHQLTPPKYHRGGNKDPKTAVLSRKLGRELDLSAWFTRPCLIIIGYLEDSACPIPLRVDGKAPNSDGLTVVRWIYPLPLVEDELRGAASQR
ncbi:MAG: hypothetical protein IH830_07035 [Planctomycetes bacterium]|nr:hypothetical protein [Planctomycetota bacterium]